MEFNPKRNFGTKGFVLVGATGDYLITTVKEGAGINAVNVPDTFGFHGRLIVTTKHGRGSHETTDWLDCVGSNPIRMRHFGGY